MADVTLIGSVPGAISSQGRFVPNPNVCVELGYALAKLGEERVILVQNTVHGGPDLLPFDLKFRRALGYEARAGEEDRSGERKILVSKLKEALRPILELKLEVPVTESPIERLTYALEHNTTGQGARARDAIYSLLDELDSMAPDFSQSGPRDEMILTALNSCA